MPPEGSTRARILPGCSSLDRGSRVAEVGFEPRTFRAMEKPAISDAVAEGDEFICCDGHSSTENHLASFPSRKFLSFAVMIRAVRRII
ncbi:hypothetical protein T265_01895 [Opisthorchis viverrini]|uniref:Uncharacterized protein n=1 Tax=Opisthorchis viverrini TaxID=6198 RepID=A0A075A129_OPIVI|nr:hypothetical protein T265_01895 [Opisthorchis viverrini]KER31962.1 hypothetical protein T265_01895 [Opisthorchis viverrini]